MLALVPILNTLLMVSLGKFEVLEPKGPYGVGYVDDSVSKSDYHMNISVFYPMRKAEYESRKHNIRENLRWFIPGAEALNRVANFHKVPAFLVQEFLTYRVE